MPPKQRKPRKKPVVKKTNKMNQRNANNTKVTVNIGQGGNPVVGKPVLVQAPLPPVQNAPIFQSTAPAIPFKPPMSSGVAPLPVLQMQQALGGTPQPPPVMTDNPLASMPSLPPSPAPTPLIQDVQEKLARQGTSGSDMIKKAFEMAGLQPVRPPVNEGASTSIAASGTSAAGTGFAASGTSPFKPDELADPILQEYRDRYPALRFKKMGDVVKVENPEKKGSYVLLDGPIGKNILKRK